MKGWRRHFMHGTSTYCSWANMISRCRNTNDPAYSNYGGRGIIVCNRWIYFVEFFEDMGIKPEGTELDRIDNDGNYEPGNCRWATKTENLRNNRHNHLLTAFGETKPMSAWAEDSRCSVSYTTLRKRINEMGWDAETAISLGKVRPHDVSKGKI